MRATPARWIVALLMATAVGTGAPPATAQITASPWTAPFTVSSEAPGSSSAIPTLAFGASGRGLVTWSYRTGTGHTGQMAAQRRLDGSYGPAVDLGSPMADPLVYGHDRAVALVLPRAPVARRVRVVFGSTSGRFGHERTIYTAPPAAFSITRMAASKRGHVVVVRRDTDRNRRSRIVLVERRPGGRFGRARVVSDDPCNVPSCRYFYGGGSDVAVAVGDRGDVVVVWEQGWWLMARVRRRGGRLGPAVRLGTYDRIQGGVRSAVSPEGAVWVAWMDHPVGSGGGPMSIKLATGRAGAREFAPTRVLDHVRDMQFTNYQRVRLVLDPSGTAFAAWNGPGPKLAEIDPAAAPPRMRRLARSGEVLALAAGQRPGDALVAWTTTVDHLAGTRRLIASVSTAGGFTGGEVIASGTYIGSTVAGFAPADRTPIVLWGEQDYIGPQTLPGGALSAVRAATRSPPDG